MDGEKCRSFTDGFKPRPHPKPVRDAKSSKAMIVKMKAREAYEERMEKMKKENALTFVDY